MSEHFEAFRTSRRHALAAALDVEYWLRLGRGEEALASAHSALLYAAAAIGSIEALVRQQRSAPA